MRVFKLKSSPSTEQLVEVLKREFSNRYDYSMFGFDCDKSIIVKKSTFIGAQISKKENEITVHGIPPSTIATLLSLVDMFITGGVFMGLPFMTRRNNFEKEVGVFLQRKFNQSIS